MCLICDVDYEENCDVEKHLAFEKQTLETSRKILEESHNNYQKIFHREAGWSVFNKTPTNKE